MSGVWWLLAIVAFLIFGKNLNLSSFNTQTGVSVPDGSFNNPNAVPTPDGMGAITIQNQTTPPENQPAPWKSICQPSAGGTIAAASSMDSLGGVITRSTYITKSQV